MFAYSHVLLPQLCKATWCLIEDLVCVHFMRGRGGRGKEEKKSEKDEKKGG